MVNQTTEQAPATPRQIEYLRSLRNDRDFTQVEAAAIEWLEARLGGSPLTKADASKTISRLLKLPKRADAGPTTGERIRGALPEVPAGRYALETPATLSKENPHGTLIGSIKFYRVDRPTEGEWAGRTYLRPVYGGPGSLQYGANIYGQERHDILSRIACDPAEAARRFGLELGICGVCGSPLTNDVSREYGIGPICRRKTGW